VDDSDEEEEPKPQVVPQPKVVAKVEEPVVAKVEEPVATPAPETKKVVKKVVAKKAP